MTRMSQCLDVIRSLDSRGRASPLGRPRPIRHRVRHNNILQAKKQIIKLKSSQQRDVSAAVGSVLLSCVMVLPSCCAESDEYQIYIVQ